jgi:hypothetical protein
MAGPIVTVALREPLSAAQIDSLGDWLHNLGDVSRVVYDPTGGYSGIANWDLRVTNGDDIGMGPIPAVDRASLCETLVSLDPQRDGSGLLYERDEDEVGQWITQVGFFPNQEIGLAAMCNSSINHRVLGHMALCLAERYDGIIDLNGAWYPPMDVARLRQWDQPKPPWQGATDPGFLWVDPRIQPFVYRGPGRIFEFHYVGGEDRPWYYNAADIEAFRAALQDPAFHLIK